MEHIAEILNSIKEVDAYQITVTDTESAEYFLIRHEMDQSRAKNVRHVNAVIYRYLDKDTLGSASFEIPAGSSESEIREMVMSHLKAAEFAVNRKYELIHDKKSHLEADPGSIAEQAEALLQVQNEVKETEEAWINSTEIFVNKEHVHMTNSCGLDISYSFMNYEMEMIITAAGLGNEIEIYQDYQGSTVDKEQLKQKINTAMHTAADRLAAEPTASLCTSDIVFSNEEAVAVYEYIAGLCDAGMIYQKVSDCAVGSPLVNDAEGDRIQISLCRNIPGSSRNFAYDSEGNTIEDRRLINNGIVESLCGTRQYCTYIGYDKPMHASNISASGGTYTDEEILKGTYLETVIFSGFSLNPMDGTFGGEIRLAYWHHDGIITPVTGGSISGSIKTCLANWKMSRETAVYDYAEIPHYTRLTGISIAGVK